MGIPAELRCVGFEPGKGLVLPEIIGMKQSSRLLSLTSPCSSHMPVDNFLLFKTGRADGIVPVLFFFLFFFFFLSLFLSRNATNDH